MLCRSHLLEEVSFILVQDIVRNGLPADRFDSVMVAGQDAAPDAEKLALASAMAMLKGGAVTNIPSLPQSLRAR